MNFVFEDDINHLNLIEDNTLRDATEGNYVYNQSPLSNDCIDLWNVNRDSHKEFKPKTFKFSKRPRKYIIPIGLNESPWEWAEGYNVKDNTVSTDLIFSKLSAEYIKDLQIGRAFLLLDSSLEGYHEDWAFDYLHLQCARYHINPSRIMFVTGNLLLEERYRIWCNKNKPKWKILCIGYPHFLYEVNKNIWSRKFVDYSEVIGFDDHIEYKKKNNTKLYSCTNKRPRPHRIWLYKELSKAGLVDKGVLSMSKFDLNIKHTEGTYELDNSELIDLVKDLPKEPYGVSLTSKPTTFFINRFNEKHALDSWVNVVSEARYYDGENTIFLSEKIFKAIALEQPFIIVGNRGSIKALQELGFKTFNKFFDEKYDELPYRKRISAIVKVLKDIDKIKDKHKWYSEMKDIFVHNNNTLNKLAKQDTNLDIKKLFIHFHSA